MKLLDPRLAALLAAGLLAPAALANPLGQGSEPAGPATSAPPQLTTASEVDGPQGQLPAHTWRWQRTTVAAVPAAPSGEGGLPERGQRYFDPQRDTPAFASPGRSVPSDLSHGVARLVASWFHRNVVPVLAAREAGEQPWAGIEPRPGRLGEPVAPRSVEELETMRLRHYSASGEGLRLSGRLVELYADDHEALEAPSSRTSARRVYRNLRRVIRDRNEALAYFRFQPTNGQARTLLLYGFEEGHAVCGDGRRDYATRFLVYDPAFAVNEDQAQSAEALVYLMYLKTSKTFAFPRQYLAAYAADGVTVHAGAQFAAEQVSTLDFQGDDAYTAMLSQNGAQAGGLAEGPREWMSGAGASGLTLPGEELRDENPARPGRLPARSWDRPRSPRPATPAASSGGVAPQPTGGAGSDDDLAPYGNDGSCDPGEPVLECTGPGADQPNFTPAPDASPAPADDGEDADAGIDWLGATYPQQPTTPVCQALCHGQDQGDAPVYDIFGTGYGDSYGNGSTGYGSTGDRFGDGSMLRDPSADPYGWYVQ